MSERGREGSRESRGEELEEGERETDKGGGKGQFKKENEIERLTDSECIGGTASGCELEQLE